MAQLSESIRYKSTHDRLSSLPGELQLQIAEHLNYSDLVRVRRASQALRHCFADPAVRLIDEMSKAWVEIERKFQDCYFSVDMNSSLLGLDVNGTSIVQQVEEYAIERGFSNTLVRWLVRPSLYHFSCSKCHTVKPWTNFPTDSLRRTFPFRPYANPLITQQDYKMMLESMTCGACTAAEQPHAYHSLGLRNGTSSIIKCHRCLTIKQAPNALSFRLRFSGFCQQCFGEVHQDWFEYKSFLQDCLARMEAYEKGEDMESLSWSGFPECPVPAEFVAALNSPNHRPLPSYTQIVLAQLSLRAAKLRLRDLSLGQDAPDLSVPESTEP
ncbi:hypothetical protein AYO20_04686 [Fonsecaea nubica]|uniref:F-box domain-containing protein n=1 Tax=Fonsecaea nubica TaxID=856822 RepID=A0A178D3S6_9EURO|nr:hypothetical protein AYO20_04686 [Fonsecaea nubica]OAL36024.1 hypothetical protein AYO20_04686 [Fonsecaea nubica]